MDLTATQVRSFFALCGERMRDNKETLCELDAQAGDGDIGLTMSKGFSAVSKALDAETSLVKIPEVFKTAAMTMMNEVPSTMGTLVASGLLRISTQASKSGYTQAIPIYAVLDQLIIGIQARGKAKLGDKTIIDALAPALAAVQRGQLESAVAVAAEAAQRTSEMPAAHGRASRYHDGSLGKVDPGAVVGSHIVACLIEASSR